MRIINIDLSQDTRCPQKVFGGNAREHNESKLVVKLPERMLRDDISYYYFEFQTVLGEHIVSPNIYKNELSDGNKISVTLWEQLLPFAGDLNFCVNAVDLAEDSTITIKGKTSICALQILKSPTGEDALIDVNSTKDELQEVIDKALQDAKDSGDFKGDPGDVNTLQMNTACANALRGSAFGSAVRMDDASPNEHTLGVKVRSKNLIPYPYAEDRKQPVAGITWTINSDGSITANGTATGNSTCWLTRKSLIPGQTYTISTGLSTPVPGCTLVANYYPIGSSNYKAWLNIQTIKTGAFPSDGDRLACYCLVSQGTTVENLVFKPQIELGSTATAYTPYISDFSTATVTRCGKNLFDTINAVKSSGLSKFSVINNTITVSQNRTSQYVSGNVLIPNLLAGKTITLSAKVTVSGVNKAALRIQWLTKSGTAFGGLIIGSPDSAGNIVVTGTVPAQPDETHNNLCLMFYSNTEGSLETGTVYTATYSDIQLELSTTATSYEPYQGQIYIPAADGTVSGVTSLYPTTTLLTNNAGALIDCTYNQDSNALIGDIDAILGTMFNDAPISAQSDEAQIQTTTEGVDE